MLNSNSKFIVACENTASFAGIPAVFPENLPRIPNREEMDTVNFSEFWDERSWGNAVTAATTAHIIIVSLSGRMDLPIPVRRWMESWPNYEPQNHPTLIVVIENEEAEASKQNVLISYFQKIAENHGMGFLCHCDKAKEFARDPQSLEQPMEIPHTRRYQDFNVLALPSQTIPG
jgi:hypothetical protein